MMNLRCRSSDRQLFNHCPSNARRGLRTARVVFLRLCADIIHVDMMQSIAPDLRAQRMRKGGPACAHQCERIARSIRLPRHRVARVRLPQSLSPWRGGHRVCVGDRTQPRRLPRCYDVAVAPRRRESNAIGREKPTNCLRPMLRPDAAAAAAVRSMRPFRAPGVWDLAPFPRDMRSGRDASTAHAT